MIQSAVTKLTIAYLGIIMFLSIIFSLYLYHISDRELNNGLRRPPTIVFRETSLYGFDDFRTLRLNEVRANLKQRLIVVNIITLVVGFAVSYALARKTLEPIDRALESQKRFTADASHELRTPLTAMQTEIEVALRDKNLSKEESRELLESNLEEVAKLRALSDGLLKLAKQDTKDIPMEAVIVKNVCNEAIKKVNKVAKQKKISIQNNIKNKNVYGNADSLTELFVILLDNAVKYSDDKSEIILSSKVKNQKVIVSVADSGQGISKKDLPYIFDRFYRADQSRNKNKDNGYGLGLSIAKNIIVMHDGNIETISKVGSGTTFKVSFPIA